MPLGLATQASRSTRQAALCRWGLRGVCHGGRALLLGLATQASCWTRCAVGIGDASIPLDAAGGAVPLGVAWSVSRWVRFAVGISDAVNASASRFNRILKRMCLRIRVSIGN